MWYTPIILTTSFFVGYMGSDPGLCVSHSTREKRQALLLKFAIECTYHCILGWGSSVEHKEGKPLSPERSEGDRESLEQTTEGLAKCADKVGRMVGH